MFSRRDFLSKTALLSASLALGSSPALSAAPKMPDLGDGSERYWKSIRNLFPLTRDKIYLNNGTLGPSPYAVVDEITRDLIAIDTQAQHGNTHELTTAALARFLQVSNTEISLTHNVTEGINIVCWGLALKRGDEVILTQQEHVGHASPWLHRRKVDGIVLKVVALGHTAAETLDNIKKAITIHTKVIAVPHIPCTIGQVLPVKEICSLARGKGIWSFIDGAHPPGMLDLDLKDIACDFYAGCCHKWMLGPKGTGFLYVREQSRHLVVPYYGGAGVDTGWDLLSIPIELDGPVSNGHQYYYGTQNESLYKGIIKSVEFQEHIGKAAIEKRVRSLANYLQEQLMEMSSDVQMLTPTEPISKAAIVAFKIKDRPVKQLYEQCYQSQIITRYVPESNIHCVRVSTHIYNSFEEIDAFLEEVDVFLHA